MCKMYYLEYLEGTLENPLTRQVRIASEDIKTWPDWLRNCTRMEGSDDPKLVGDNV